jgi:hypothetical protein
MFIQRAIRVCLSVLLLTTQTKAFAQPVHSDSNDVGIRLARRIGIQDQFLAFLESRDFDSGREPERLMLEAKLIRTIWLAQIQVDRLISQLDEEETIVTEAINKIENRKAIMANTTDSANFLSSSIVSLVGSAKFIPAPPPQPTVPNILFSIANGTSMLLSTVSLLELRSGTAKIALPQESMLLPIFDDQFQPQYSEMVWTYLNTECPEEGYLTPRKLLISKWEEDAKGENESLVDYRKKIAKRLGLDDRGKPVTLGNLRIRQHMLEQLEVYLVKMSRSLADLIRLI